MLKRTKSYTAGSVPDVRGRVERALREGRSQQALELAKTLYRQDPVPANLELLRNAYLARGRELHDRGADRDAVIVLRAALAVPGEDPAWLTQVAELLALSGDIADALALLPRLPDPAAPDLLFGHAADTAVKQGASAAALLPDAHRADLDRVTRSFALAEAGQDEAAREVLAGIGLRSPFLEWKLLVRGLLAYYANDDARALENWQRLNPARLPARLAAPLRQAIDPPFRAAQPAATQALLQQSFDRLQGSTLAARLRALRSALAGGDNLAAALRQAEALLPDLRRDGPGLADHLARVFYWAATETGPDDVQRYQRVFGRQPDDPQFNRLAALANDRGGDLAEAHKFWQRYEHDIAASPSRWPDGQADRARALVWLRMGRNAASVPGPAKMARLADFFDDLPGKPRPLKPSADRCFLRAIELAPDLLEPYEALVDYYRDEGHEDKEAEAARKLLDRFPEHVPTLAALGELLSRRDEQVEALELFQRALRGNPLDRELRAKVTAAHLGCARLHAAAGRFEAARQEVRSALALQAGTPETVLLCRWAAVEFKAGDAARAEDLLAQARAGAGSDLAVSYRMLIEAARVGLPARLKKRFDGEFTAGVAAPPSGAAAAELALATAVLSKHVTYVGQKTHQKKVLAYLDRAKTASCTETQYREVCSALLELDAVRLVRQYLARAQKKFPKSPYFPYVEALSYFARKGPRDMPYWKVRPLLEKAERLARALPETEQLKGILDDIATKLKATVAFDPFGPGGIFDSLFGDPYRDEDDGDDFDDGY